MYLFRLAMRNLLRQFRRNVLSLVSIVVGVFLLIIGSGFVSGLTENMLRAQIDSLSGHVVAVPAEYPTAGLRHPVDQLYKTSPEAKAWLDAETETWTPRIYLAPRAVHGQDAIRVRLIGYDPKTDASVFPRTSWQLKGKPAHEVDYGVLISTGAATLLDLKAGDRFVLETRTVDGAINAMHVNVSGVVKAGNPVIDAIGMFAPLPLVDELVDAQGRVSHLAVKLDHRDESTAFAPTLAAKLGQGVESRTWQTETEALVDAQRLRQNMLNIIVLALLLMAATGIANTILMAAYERVRELGTMRAMGLQRSGVITLFAVEGLAMGILGGLVGGVLGGAFTYHYGQTGIDMSSLVQAKGGLNNIPFSTMLYMDFSMGVVVASVVAAVVVAVLASLYPAFIASRKLVADAVRAE
jgi:putative ABC transport system permease protein